MVQMKPATFVNRVVAREARPAVHEHALDIGVRAEGNLARHREHGRHRVTVTAGRKTDAFVNLEGPAPLSVEFGHYTGYKNREYVPGLRVLRDAAGI